MTMRNASIVVIVHCEGIPTRNHGCGTRLHVVVPLTPKKDQDGYTKNHLYIRESDVDGALASAGWRSKDVCGNLLCPSCAAMP